MIGAFAIFFCVWIGSMVYWIVALVEILRIPDLQFRGADADKTLWALVVALTGIIGALIWRFSKRKQVLSATGIHTPPPGWYPDATGGFLRWWDGHQWTDVVHSPPNPGDSPQ